MKKLTHTLFSKIFPLLIFIFVITSLEIALCVVWRLDHLQLQQEYDKWELNTMRSKNRTLIYTYRPNHNGTNAQGYFDFDYPFIKNKDVFRIIVIGDSLAQGVIDDGGDIKLEETAFKVLEKKLNQMSQKKYEVIVLARSGYSTSQELVLLRNEAFRYNPDLIIWSYVLNDPAHPLYHNANGDLGRYFYRPRSHFLHFLSKKIFYIKENIKRQKAPSCEFHLFLHWAYWHQVEKNLKKIHDLTQHEKIPVLFIIHPIFEAHTDAENYSLHQLHKQLKLAAAQAGLIPIDLIDTFKGYSVEELKQDKHDLWHPNSKGHKIMGEFIFKKILRHLHKS